MIEEEWRYIPDSDDYYISNLGNVRKGENGKLLKSQYNKKTNYMQQMTYTKDGRPKLINIHRVVADAFLEKPKDKDRKVVTHISGDRRDNSVTNLMFVYKGKKKNMEHGLVMNGVEFEKPQKKIYRYIVKQKLLNGFTVATFIDFDELGAMNYKKQSILLASRKSTPYKGYLWEVTKQKLSDFKEG